MLKARVVMPDGVVVGTDEGVPQGGPLSPLLSNIVLDELDVELSRRGLRFVRYADDCNVYVRSQRAGERVMASLTRFIEGRMRLRVNREKSAVARPEERHFLGFSLRRKPVEETVQVLMSKRSAERLDQKIRELTPRSWGDRLERCIQRINEYFRGWVGFFSICTPGTEWFLRHRDTHLRARLRAIVLKQWRSRRTRARKLMALGLRRPTAWRCVYDGRRSIWALSYHKAVERSLSIAYFAKRGLCSLAALWLSHSQHITASRQLLLPLG
jgi:hypothetical protein